VWAGWRQPRRPHWSLSALIGPDPSVHVIACKTTTTGQIITDFHCRTALSEMLQAKR
jgi:hypothetical protein